MKGQVCNFLIFWSGNRHIRWLSFRLQCYFILSHLILQVNFSDLSTQTWKPGPPSFLLVYLRTQAIILNMNYTVWQEYSSSSIRTIQWVGRPVYLLQFTDYILHCNLFINGQYVKFLLSCKAGQILHIGTSMELLSVMVKHWIRLYFFPLKKKIESIQNVNNLQSQDNQMDQGFLLADWEPAAWWVVDLSTENLRALFAHVFQTSVQLKTCLTGVFSNVEIVSWKALILTVNER